jgi:hypothetical protein
LVKRLPQNPSGLFDSIQLQTNAGGGDGLSGGAKIESIKYGDRCEGENAEFDEYPIDGLEKNGEELKVLFK